MIVVSGSDLVAELVDESRFAKHVGFGMDAYRPVTGDGLFTAYNDEPNWQLAHDILTPAFTREAMHSYHAEMLTTARGLTRSWDQQIDTPIDVVGDATKLALETIGRAGFGYDFGSFDRSELHPFVEAMISTLQYSMLPPQEQALARESNDKKIRFMHDMVDDVVRNRQASGDNQIRDLLGAMLNTSHPRTGERLDPANIRNQITTFLIAGYGTSAGMLSFALYFLAKHPDVLAAAQDEVDQVFGADPDADPAFEQVGKLRYVRRVLDEALRLWPPTSAFLREARIETVLGGTYRMGKGAWVAVLVPMLHRDPVWGDDVESFDPNRFTPEAVRARPAHAYKPFGTGARACIGRQFAQHEATLALGLLLHRYQLCDHANYQLTVGEGGFFMPAGLSLTVSSRSPRHRP